MPSVDLETRTGEQLARLVALFAEDFILAQPEGGPISAVQVQKVIDTINTLVFAQNTAKIDGLSAAVGSFAAGTIIDVKKATKAALDADLAWDADKIGWVHSDPDVSKNDLYVKSGASGAGAWAATGVFKAAAEALVSALAAEAEAAKVAAEAAAATAVSAAIIERNKETRLRDQLERVKPTNARPTCLFILDPLATRARLRTKSVLNGGPDDYDEWDMIDAGDYLRANDPLAGPNKCWVLHSCRSMIGGRLYRHVEQPLDIGKCSAFEHATMVGKMADAGAYTGGENASWRRYGGVHGYVKLNGGHVYLDGINISSDWEFGDDAYRGEQILFNFNYQAKTPDGTVIPGNHEVNHIFNVEGQFDDHNISSTAETSPGVATYGHQDAYVMLPSTEAGWIKHEGQAPVAVGGLMPAGGNQSIQKPLDGPTIAAWNGSTAKRMSFYRDASPTIILEHFMPLVDRMQPYPGKSECKSSVNFVIDNLDPVTGIMNQKGYMNLMSSVASPGTPAPLPMLGNFRFLSNRRTTIRTGGAL